MRAPTILLAWAVAVPCLAAAAAPAAAADAEPAARVIVRFRSSPADAVALAADARGDAAAAAQRRAERVGALGQRLGMALASGMPIGERTQAVSAAGVSSAQLAARLAAQADVEYAVVDGRRSFRAAAPNDPLYRAGQNLPYPPSGQWYLRAPTAEVKSAIDAEAAWNLATGSPAVVVAVLDTGVRFDHEDLRRVAAGGVLLDGYDFLSSPAAAGDGDGRDADPTDTGDFLGQAEKDADPGNFGNCDVQRSSSWHGTRTSSLVAALTDNGIGMASIGRGVRVLPLRVLGKCGGRDSDILAALRWAGGLHVDGVPDNPTPARIVNLSFGGDGACHAGYLDVLAELAARGVFVVASAGNASGRAVSTPANCPGVFAVGGLRHAGTKVGFSDVGPEIALSAPGGNCVNSSGACLYPIITAVNPGTTRPVAGGSAYSDAFNASFGTSFSAPLVAGTAALMVSAQPLLTPADLRTALRETARPFPTTGGDLGDGVPIVSCAAPGDVDQLQCYCTTATCGAGMLDAGGAVAAAASVVARITASTEAPVAGQALQLSAAGSPVAADRQIVGYQWTLLDGGGIVSGFASGGTTATSREVTLTPHGGGRFVVALTVTDSRNRRSTATRQFDVAAGSSGGSGGGALDGGWLAGLAAAVLALAASGRHGRG